MLKGVKRENIEIIPLQFVRVRGLQQEKVKKITNKCQ
jgi:hypothetical protein